MCIAEEKEISGGGCFHRKQSHDQLQQHGFKTNEQREPNPLPPAAARIMEVD